MLTSETKRRIDACRDILVGKLPLPTDQVELITLALIYKFMDDLDEESVQLGGQRSFFTGPLADYRWRALLPQTVSADDRMTRFARGIELLGGAELEIEEKGQKRRLVPAAHLPGLFRDIFRNAFLKFRDGRILTLFLTEINGFAYSHSEELGNAFEYALQCMGTQGENGQFRTPRHIIDFIVACLEPRPEDRILDPACGTGGFLVSAYKRILANHTSPGSDIPGDRLKHAQRQKLYANLTGYDITDLMVKLTKVNLFLHGFPDPAVHIYDTLSNDARWSEKADLILANPPFMTPKGGVTPHTRFRIAAKKAEVLFTDYIAEHLSPEGRAGIIVPNGIVATTQNAYVKLRRFLVEDSLVAVVSLPAGVFKPYSGVKTSILFLDKALARRTKEVLFLKVAADGFDLGDKRNPVEANDLPEAERVVNAWLKGRLNNELRRTVSNGIVWRTIEKIALFESSSCGLQAEQFLGNGDAIKNETSKVRLNDVCEAILTGPFGSSLHQSDYITNGIPVINPQNIVNGCIVPDADKSVGADTRDRLSEFTVRENDIVIARRGEMGRCAIATAEMNGWICGTGSFVIRVNSSALASFVALAIASPKAKEFLEENAIGVTLKNLNQQVLGDLEIPLPPLDEQRRIVEEIEGYQKVIDGARQMLAGYRPRVESGPERKNVALGEICQVAGSIIKKIKKHLPYIGSDSIESGTGKLLQCRSCEEQGIQGPVYEFCEIRILYSKIRPYLNKLTLTDFHGYCSSDIYPLLVDEKKALPKFVLYHLLSDKFISDISGFHERVSIPKINRQQLFGVEIPLPPLDEQRRIVAELDTEAAQMDTVRALIPRFEAKIQRVLDRVWGVSQSAGTKDETVALDKVAEAAEPDYDTGGKEEDA